MNYAKAMKAKKAGNSGFTLIELIIVLAIIAIIGAILIPTFLSTTDRARLRSDIQSARVLQNAVDLYNMEQTTRIETTGDLTNDILGRLDTAGYIDQSRVAAQTNNANFVFNNGLVQVDISGSGIDNDLVSQLSDQEQAFVTGNP